MTATFPLPSRDRAVIGDILERRAREHPDRTYALFESGAVWSYAETAQRTWRVAAGLQHIGARAGEVVAAWLPNGEAALLAWLATSAIGGIYAPLNTAYRGRLLENALNLLGARVLIAHAELLDRLDGLDLTALETVVVVGDDGAPPAPLGYPAHRWGDLDMATPGRPLLDTPVEPWDDAAILSTSGTTGVSKAVRRPYVLYEKMAENAFDHVGVGKDDRFFVCAPMFHGGADVPVYAMLRNGGSIAVVSGFRTEAFWDDVRRWGCTVAWIHSAMSIFLAKAPPRDDDADNPLRLAMLAPMFPGMHEFARRFDITLFTVYGMTELPCVFSRLDPPDHRSLGTPLPGYEARLVDAHDREVAVGEPGELVVRHAVPWAITPGYYRHSEATEAAWRNGWFHSGDVFVQDAAGDYTLVDRKKDAIRRRGENVSSAEVENELLEHPDVVEAAVVGVPTDIEEEILAFVVLAPDRPLDPVGLTRFLVERLPYYAVPRYLERVDALPRTPSLRVDKVRMRELGVRPTTWDREAAGLRLRRERLR